MSVFVLIEYVHKVKGVGYVFEGIIESSTNDIDIQDGQSFDVKTSTGFKGRGLYGRYGHKIHRINDNDRIGIAIKEITKDLCPEKNDKIVVIITTKTL